MQPLIYTLCYAIFIWDAGVFNMLIVAICTNIACHVCGCNVYGFHISVSSPQEKLMNISKGINIQILLNVHDGCGKSWMY